MKRLAIAIMVGAAMVGCVTYADVPPIDSGSAAQMLSKISEYQAIYADAVTLWSRVDPSLQDDGHGHRRLSGNAAMILHGLDTLSQMRDDMHQMSILWHDLNGRTDFLELARLDYPDYAFTTEQIDTAAKSDGDIADFQQLRRMHATDQLFDLAKPAQTIDSVADGLVKQYQTLNGDAVYKWNALWINRNAVPRKEIAQAASGISTNLQQMSDIYNRLSKMQGFPWKYTRGESVLTSDIVSGCNRYADLSAGLTLPSLNTPVKSVPAYQNPAGYYPSSTTVTNGHGFSVTTMPADQWVPIYQRYIDQGMTPAEAYQAVGGLR